MQGEIISLESAKKLFEYEVLKKQTKRIKRLIDNIYEQYKKVEDKELITNRCVDISVIEEIDRILKEKK